MTAGSGSRYNSTGNRRRSSALTSHGAPVSLYTANSTSGPGPGSTTMLGGAPLGQLDEACEDGDVGGGRAASSGRSAVVPRRRAVDMSDLRSCALVQTQMKTWKHYPE